VAGRTPHHDVTSELDPEQVLDSELEPVRLREDAAPCSARLCGNRRDRPWL